MAFQPLKAIDTRRHTCNLETGFRINFLIRHRSVEIFWFYAIGRAHNYPAQMLHVPSLLMFDDKKSPAGKSFRAGLGFRLNAQVRVRQA